MAGWMCPDRETIEWDGTIKAKNFSFNGQSFNDLFVNVTGDTMTGSLTMDMADQSGSGEGLKFQQANEQDLSIATRKDGDTFQRFVLRGDGVIAWGSGSGIVDTNLYRSAANTLKTDDAFIGASTASFSGALNMNSNRINNVTDPSSAQDAATKNYVDTKVFDISSQTNLAVTSPIVLTNDTLSLGTVDISSNTNLAATSPIVLTGDTLSLGNVTATTNLVGGNHKIFYTNGSGAVVELAHGNSTYVLTSNGTTSAPSWQAPVLPAVPFFSQTQPARSLNTTYQNTTGYNMIVYGSIACRWSDNNTQEVGYYECKTDSSSPPTTIRLRGGTIVAANIVTNNTVAEQSFPFSFIVKAGHYYRIDSTASGTLGRVTLEYWNEVTSLEGT